MIYSGVVAGSCILAYLARALVETRPRKRDCYSVWAACKVHPQQLFQVVVISIGPEFQHQMLQGYCVVALAADHDEDTLRTVSSDVYVPNVDSDNSQNDDTTGLLFHQQDRQETLCHCRLSPCEYAWFCQFLMTKPEGPRLLAAFWEILVSEFDKGRYPSPPVDPAGESLPDFPALNHGDLDLSVRDIWEDMWDK